MLLKNAKRGVAFKNRIKDVAAAKNVVVMSTNFVQ